MLLSLKSQQNSVIAVESKITYIDGLVQEICNSSVLAMELQFSCT